MKFDNYYAYRNDVYLIMFNHESYFTLFVVICLKLIQIFLIEICRRYLRRELVARGAILEQSLP